MQKITVVDAFTETPFSGNPAAVCILPADRPEAWMQSVAREMNLSETAFLNRRGEAWSLRWFTPACEVELCGHATLASAHVLWEEGHLSPDGPARFQTLSGPLSARREGGWIAMDFPATPEEAAVAPRDLPRALGVPVHYVGRTRFDYLVEVEDEGTLRGLTPDLRAVRNLGTRGIIVTSAAEPTNGYDFASRYFAPAFGVDEDPVTGSAHCALGPYWMEKLGRNDLVGYQCSARGGTVRVRVEGERVILSGRAVTVLRGDLIPE
jgi:PhzF family phenazine biosynthesis protein